MAIVAMCALIAAACTQATTSRGHATRGPVASVGSLPSSRSLIATPKAPASGHLVDRTLVFGTSVRGVPLRLVELGDPGRPGVLVVGCIHGNEAAGIAVVNALLGDRNTARVHFWLVATLNPDGELANRRTNAHGVDLNRNFPYRWQRLQQLGGTNYSGDRALSEPESQAMASLLRRIHPAVGVWFHQSLNAIDISQGPRAFEDKLAAALQVKEVSLADYPGSAIGFEDALFPRSAFAFELPPGALTSSRAQQIAAAISTAAATS